MAELLKMNVEYVRYLERSGQLTATKTRDGKSRFSRTDVEELAQARTAEGKIGRSRSTRLLSARIHDLHEETKAVHALLAELVAALAVLVEQKKPATPARSTKKRAN